jgi:superfamily II RNA helicase
MVFICDKPFPSEEKTYDNIFSPIILSDFQKWALKALTEGNDVLITAHTGSGKTLPAEYLIRLYTSKTPLHSAFIRDTNHALEKCEGIKHAVQHKKKKIIYASPIKALSNQKLYEFRRKYPEISFGILTGDIKDNPEADVLVMTTEILRNTLFIKGQAPYKPQNNGQVQNGQSKLLFEMDFDTELAGVIFDEVHYINDADRGSVWEQAIMMLPKHVQILMLSATINEPAGFASWVESRGVPCYLIPTNHRVVPLTHYMWVSTHLSTNKAFKGTQYEHKLQQLANKPVVIKKSDETFVEENYHKVYDLLHFMKKSHIFVKRAFVLNELVRYLKLNDMLPAICFVFSRKQVEQCASEIAINLYDEDEQHKTSVIAAECKNILMSKLPNYREYLNLPEYTDMIALLEKGIAIHHAGIMSVLREMVELLFEKGFIKLLFATETFAVGINMPTKTAIFTGLTKFNGTEHRPLYSHEYTQMAGRAGRRGLDKVGHVIHCNNIFELDSAAQYSNMLCGPAQTITSKFKVSFGLVLNTIANEVGNTNANGVGANGVASANEVGANKVGNNIYSFLNKTLLNRDMKRDLNEYYKKEKAIDKRIDEQEDKLAALKTPRNILQEYKAKSVTVLELTNSARKNMRRDMSQMEEKYPSITKDVTVLLGLDEMLKERDYNNTYITQTKEYMNTTIGMTIDVLEERGFLSESVITKKGIIARHFQEVHPLMMADLLIETNYFKDLSPPEIVGILSCFTNCISVADENKIHVPETDYDETNRITKQAENILMSYSDEEAKYELYTGETYEMNYDIQNPVIRWCEAEDEKDCKIIIQELKEKEVFLGDFVKSLLKINNIASELEKMCETIGHIELLEKVSQIPSLTLKYVVTNQSLYI